MALTLEWTGDEEGFIRLAEYILAESGDGMGLDSRDMGDAMGVIISETMMNDSELTMNFEGNLLTARIDYDLFSWEGLKG